MSPAKSSKRPVASAAGIPRMPSILEWGILAAIELLVIVMVKSAGFQRGVELMPWPDRPSTPHRRQTWRMVAVRCCISVDILTRRAIPAATR